MRNHLYSFKRKGTASVGHADTFRAFYLGLHVSHAKKQTKLNSVALVRTRTIPTERPPPVGEVSANFCG